MLHADSDNQRIAIDPLINLIQNSFLAEARN